MVAAGCGASVWVGRSLAVSGAALQANMQPTGLVFDMTEVDHIFQIILLYSALNSEHILFGAFAFIVNSFQFPSSVLWHRMGKFTSSPHFAVPDHP